MITQAVITVLVWVVVALTVGVCLLALGAFIAIARWELRQRRERRSSPCRHGPSATPWCAGMDWSFCPESSFGPRDEQRQCAGFKALDRRIAREEIYDPDRAEQPNLKYRALSVSHEYEWLLGEEREATSPRCPKGRAW